MSLSTGDYFHQVKPVKLGNPSYFDGSSPANAHLQGDAGSG